MIASLQGVYLVETDLAASHADLKAKVGELRRDVADSVSIARTFMEDVDVDNPTFQAIAIAAVLGYAEELTKEFDRLFGPPE